MIVDGRSACRVHLGKIVLVLQPSPTYPGCWFTSPALCDATGARIAWHDSHLRPLRPGPGCDEMLERLGRPAAGGT